jgi:hypothetical protein
VTAGRCLGAALMLLACTGTAGCSAAASAALGVALNIAVKATELDTAVIENLRARRSDTAAPSSGPKESR